MEESIAGIDDKSEWVRDMYRNLNYVKFLKLEIIFQVIVRNLVLTCIALLMVACSSESSLDYHGAEGRALAQTRTLSTATIHFSLEDLEEANRYIANADVRSLALALAQKGYISTGEIEDIVLDPWGNEIKIGILDGAVFVWSTGANQVNEFGHGDDISELKVDKSVYGVKRTRASQEK